MSTRFSGSYWVRMQRVRSESGLRRASSSMKFVAVFANARKWLNLSPMYRRVIASCVTTIPSADTAHLCVAAEHPLCGCCSRSRGWPQWRRFDASPAGTPKIELVGDSLHRIMHPALVRIGLAVVCGKHIAAIVRSASCKPRFQKFENEITERKNSREPFPARLLWLDEIEPSFKINLVPAQSQPGQQARTRHHLSVTASFELWRLSPVSMALNRCGRFTVSTCLFSPAALAARADSGRCSSGSNPALSAPRPFHRFRK